MEWQKAAEGLIASGPLAAVLGFACAKLWEALQKEKADHVATLKGMLPRSRDSDDN